MCSEITLRVSVGSVLLPWGRQEVQKGREGPTAGPGGREGLTHSKFRREAGRAGRREQPAPGHEQEMLGSLRTQQDRGVAQCRAKQRQKRRAGASVKGLTDCQDSLGLYSEGGESPGLCAEEEHTETCIFKWVPLAAHGERSYWGDRLETRGHAQGDHTVGLQVLVGSCVPQHLQVSSLTPRES